MTETPVADRVPRPRFSLLAIALVISLALNLLAAGLVTSHFIREHRAEAIHRPTGLELLPRKFFGDLSAERRKVLLELLRARRGGFRERLQALRAASVKIAEALEAEPYDPSATEAAVNAFGATGKAMIDGGTQAAMAMIGQLTPPERLTLAQRIRKRAEKRR